MDRGGETFCPGAVVDMAFALYGTDRQAREKKEKIYDRKKIKNRTIRERRKINRMIMPENLSDEITLM